MLILNIEINLFNSKNYLLALTAESCANLYSLLLITMLSQWTSKELRCLRNISLI